jgi:hypothetical protein
MQREFPSVYAFSRRVVPTGLRYVVGLPFAALLLSGTSLTPAMAYCNVIDGVATCMGADPMPIVYDDYSQDRVTTVNLRQVPETIDATRGGDGFGPAVYIRDKGGATPVPGDWSTHNQDGQKGVDGDAGQSLSATVTLDYGFDITGASAVELVTQGWHGSAGHEDVHFDKHAQGGWGGDGGAGGDLVFEAKYDGKPATKKVGAIKATGKRSDSRGIQLTTFGGNGGLGGWAESDGGLDDAKGGIGGAGGAGGSVTLSLLDGHYLDYNGASFGIQVLSQGGYGGAGGYGDVSGANTSYGGSGFMGGDGGDITVSAKETLSKITTTGFVGIEIASLGGDGGTGGNGNYAGDGGAAGAGGNITADLMVDVTTTGANAYYGIYLKSASGVTGESGDGSHAGDPGKPKDAGTVTLTLTSSSVVTDNSEADAILLQSIGGMGGAGGDASGFIAYGATGGVGGNGNTLTATLISSALSTKGAHANALYAQSIGGGGGKAGKTSGVIAALAADAGAGGDGGTVNVTLTDSILETTGLNSAGVKIHAIGGGGGSSGASDGFYAVGGQAGLGGNGGAVNLNLDGATINTMGANSVGILVESIGAGGGDAYSPSGAFAFGQNGGGGGNGDKVTFTSKGFSLVTQGDHADGVILQSIGGGGGKGASSFAAIDIIEPLLGTSGGAGGFGGDISFTGSSHDSITTGGDHARGFFAQSLGGGGGIGGNTVSIDIGLTFNSQSGSSSFGIGQNGGTVAGSVGGAISTAGDNSAGSLIQSIGGGGGASGNSIEAGVSLEFNHDMGSDGGTGGNGGTVDFTNNAKITTLGRDSDGILAQSVGGGGGQSSTVIDANVGVNIGQYGTTQGAQGGIGGSGGKVTVTSNGDISTTGDQSLGILAQSLGGGGGKSGMTIDGDITVSLGAVTLGQSGGGGGQGGDVEVVNKGSITTAGHLAAAIVAQSIAGGGGQAGMTVNGNIGLSLDYTHGGDGGEGGEAGDVKVTNNADLETQGDGAFGILLQSLGGGGGNGGLTANGAVSVVNVMIGVGGDGGIGGTSGTADVTNTAKINTKGNYAVGILVNVTGGSGGSAGMLAQGSGTGGPISGAISVAVGGSGGAGGKGGSATATNSGAIETSGYAASGIVVQSMGGNGGMGGAVYAGTLNVSTEGSGTVNVTVGGDGGDSGQGGDVTVTNHGSVTTHGHYADAIYAQSVGGNGGSGGLSYGAEIGVDFGGTVQSNVQVGGTGGSGAVAGGVSVTNTSQLTTTGGNSHGIFAQSIGGNGGDGGAGYGFFGNFGREKEKYLKIALNSQVGGYGGTGSHAGTVTIDNSGKISTAQDTSYGIFAQSVGGGGGDGGNAGAYSIGYTHTPKNEEGEEAESKGVTISYTMGGFGGGGGHGDTVNVTNGKGADITTSGTASYAIFAQSVGGSGGIGGNGEPDLKGWLADVYEVYEQINTAKEIYEQVKGFPKSLIESFSVNVGGGAGDASNGGDVIVSNESNITTLGSSGTGIFAQSVGGGGGSGGDGSQGLLTSLTVAGSSGGGGDGGTVNVTNTGTIYTEGEGAMGIFAQSLGGGGGAVGDIETTLEHELDNLWETVGSLIFKPESGGDGGDGGDVTVTMSGTITTSGKNAHGIFVHSVGGGGGAQGELLLEFAEDNPGYIGSEGLDGNGGFVDIAVDNKGVVDVQGEGAVGIFAQSASGGGESYSKGVRITVDGTVRAEGAKSRAILAQASSSYEHDPDGKNPQEAVVQINIKSGALVETTSADAYETIAIKGGRTVLLDGSIYRSNNIYNEGALRSADIGSVVVRNDKTASLTIVNDGGNFMGSVALDSANAQGFYNIDGGVAELGTSFDLGGHANSEFQNSAVMSAGKVGEIATSRVTTGSFTQDGTGVYKVDALFDAAGNITHDKIVVDVHGKDGQVSLAGTIEANWAKETVMPDGHVGFMSVLATVGGGGAIDITGLTVANTAAVSYSVANKDNNTRVEVDYTVDYSGKTSGVQLGKNAQEFASFYSKALQAIETGPQSLELKTALKAISHKFLNARTGEELAQHYLDHSAGQSLSNATAAVASSQALHRLLQSCPTLDPNLGEDFFRQRDCVWMQAIGNRHFEAATSNSRAFREDTTGIAGAFQKEILDDTFIEVGGQLEYIKVKSSTYGQSGTRFSAGVALKREVGPMTFSTTVGGGVYDLDQSRYYALGATSHVATADIKGRFLTAEARVSSVFEQHGFYAKPAVALSVTRLWQDSYSERGSGALNWNVGGISKTSVAVAPILEVGRAFNVQDRPTVAFLRAGLTAQLTNPSVSNSAVLAGTDASFGSLSSTTSPDRMRADFAAGFDMDVSERFSVSVLGQAGFSENTTDFGGYARMKLRF